LFLGVGILRPLYGTTAVLVIAGVIAGMPLGVQIIKSGLMQLGGELEEASRIAGASWWATYRRIVLRLMAPTLLAVGMITFVGAARNIGNFALLTTSANRPLSMLQLDYVAQRKFEEAVVVACIIMFVSLAGALVARLLGLRGGITQGLSDEGARVVCVDVAEDNARQCADWIAKRGGTSLGIACDVTDEGQVEAMVGRVRDAYGGVDILVNNAGILGGLSVLEMPLDRWSRQIAVNLTGTFLCTKHAARLMVAQGRPGSIIVIVSTAGHQGQAGNIGYCTSKSGLLNFTRAAA